MMEDTEKEAGNEENQILSMEQYILDQRKINKLKDNAMEKVRKLHDDKAEPEPAAD